MHFYESISEGVKKLASSLMILAPYVFIVLIIFSFDEASIAALTLLCAVLHELGHVLAMAIIGKRFSLRGVFSGLRLKPERLLSYSEEIAVAASGPLINLLLFAAFIFLGGYFTVFALINLFTALANLMPIAGYDGYRITSAIISKYSPGGRLHSVLRLISFISLTLLTLISLYFVSRFNSGYWPTFVFMIFMLREIKNDRRVFFARKKEILRDFERF